VSHGWPPFILVCDVGHVIEVYADFSGQGKNYAQFPDRQSFRIYLEDLCRQDVRDRLVGIWTAPMSLVSDALPVHHVRRRRGPVAEGVVPSLA
jgi:hypothetical protein